MILQRVLIAGTVAIIWGGSAQAAFRVCNETEFVQGLSVGYQGESDWISEGWWNIQPKACATPIPGDLTLRHVYYRTEVNGGDFEGQNYYFCTSKTEYTIVGDGDCVERGYDREDFREVDVGAGNTDFTLTLVSDAVATVPETPVAPDNLGLRICNETKWVQAVSIGYDGAEGWTSEGWWNLQPNACTTVVAGELKQRYYYYRAEVDGGPFEGTGHYFCTSKSEYTIYGDTSCVERGYDREDFREVDTGATSKSFTMKLVPG